eukprot:6195547-Pleurochrysis_carterae.AAC.1
MAYRVLGDRSKAACMLGTPHTARRRQTTRAPLDVVRKVSFAAFSSSCHVRRPQRGGLCAHTPPLH